MPIFFRLARDTTRIERINSYSAGSPRSKNGITNSSAPRVNTSPMKMSLITRALSSLAGTRNGLIPYRSWASRACGEYFTVSIIFALTPPSDTA